VKFFLASRYETRLRMFDKVLRRIFGREAR
jgi:hypothetical protein